MISQESAFEQVEGPSSQTPWIVDFLWHANPWVIVIGALVLFFLARTLVHSLITVLARHVALVAKMAWEALTGSK
ncbi:hypothetical protein ACGF5M_02950 [Gemmatimonadota bacterium]